MAKNQQKAAQYYQKGIQAMQNEQFSIARSSLIKALEFDKDNPSIMLKLAQLQMAIGQPGDAVDVLKRCVKKKPNDPDTLLLLAQGHMMLREIDLMHRALDKGIAWDAEHGPCIHAKVAGYLNSGELELAQQVIDRVSGIQKPHALIRMARIKFLRANKQHEEGIAQSIELLNADDVAEKYKRSSRFELGHLYDAVGEYAQAFESFKLANDGHIPGKTLHAESFMKRWSRDVLNGIPAADHDDKRPVFIVGMPRSGTTLTEQILAAHPQVSGIGECPLLAQQLRKRTVGTLTGADVQSYAAEYSQMLNERAESSSTRVIDKHMGAEQTLGLISKVFPNAKIIHCLRDPIDSCLSAYFQNFGTNISYSRDLSMLANQYVAHRQLMEHWDDVLDLTVHTSTYEELVANPEPRSRELIDHLQIEWDDACLRYHESKKYVATASSVQVRSPIYQTSRQRWRNYEAFIGPLIDGLAEYTDTEAKNEQTHIE